jgi:putative hemolysin
VTQEDNGGSGSAIRTYVVLEQHHFDDEPSEAYFVEVHRVDARNGQNAMRKAFRELKGDEEAEATLVVIPAGQWKPTVVSGRRRQDITVSIGA